ncbi:MAG: hypothetical protein A4E67_02203 [Syntrophaceae bacterium PtaB.Bin038]|nr:MAG: hypothetical protein A4E67_02203 [Syntrophaceae bacterium PtaB.Bin038]
MFSSCFVVLFAFGLVNSIQSLENCFRSLSGERIFFLQKSLSCASSITKWTSASVRLSRRMILSMSPSHFFQFGSFALSSRSLILARRCSEHALAGVFIPAGVVSASVSVSVSASVSVSDSVFDVHRIRNACTRSPHSVILPNFSMISMSLPSRWVTGTSLRAITAPFSLFSVSRGLCLKRFRIRTTSVSGSRRIILARAGSLSAASVRLMVQFRSCMA